MVLQIRWYGCKGGTLFENSFQLRAQGNISALNKIFAKIPKIGLTKNVDQNLDLSGYFSHYILAQVISVNLGHKCSSGPGAQKR